MGSYSLPTAMETLYEGSLAKNPYSINVWALPAKPSSLCLRVQSGTDIWSFGPMPLSTTYLEAFRMKAE